MLGGRNVLIVAFVATLLSCAGAQVCQGTSCLGCPGGSYSNPVPKGCTFDGSAPSGCTCTCSGSTSSCVYYENRFGGFFGFLRPARSNPSPATSTPAPTLSNSPSTMGPSFMNTVQPSSTAPNRVVSTASTPSYSPDPNLPEPIASPTFNPGPSFSPEPVQPSPSYSPDPVHSPEPVQAPQPVHSPDPVHSPEPVQSPETQSPDHSSPSPNDN